MSLVRFKPIPKHVDHKLFHEIARKNYEEFMGKMERVAEVTQARDGSTELSNRHE